jgi:hypothetical protein
LRRPYFYRALILPSRAAIIIAAASVTKNADKLNPEQICSVRRTDPRRPGWMNQNALARQFPSIEGMLLFADHCSSLRICSRSSASISRIISAVAPLRPCWASSRHLASLVSISCFLRLRSINLRGREAGKGSKQARQNPPGPPRSNTSEHFFGRRTQKALQPYFSRTRSLGSWTALSLRLVALEDWEEAAKDQAPLHYMARCGRSRKEKAMPR